MEKLAVEAGDILIADGLGDVGDGGVGQKEHSLRLFHLAQADVLARRLAHGGMERAAEGGGAHGAGGRERFDARRAPLLQRLLHQIQRGFQLKEGALRAQGERRAALAGGGELLDERAQAGRAPAGIAGQGDAANQLRDQGMRAPADDAAQAHAGIEQLFKPWKLRRAPAAEQLQGVEARPDPAAVFAALASGQMALEGKDDLHVALGEGHVLALHHAGAAAARAHAKLQHRMEMQVGNIENLQRAGLGGALVQSARLRVNVKRRKRQK